MKKIAKRVMVIVTMLMVIGVNSTTVMADGKSTEYVVESVYNAGNYDEFDDETLVEYYTVMWYEMYGDVFVEEGESIDVDYIKSYDDGSIRISIEGYSPYEGGVCYYTFVDRSYVVYALDDLLMQYMYN